MKKIKLMFTHWDTKLNIQHYIIIYIILQFKTTCKIKIKIKDSRFLKCIGPNCINQLELKCVIRITYAQK